MVHEVDIKRVVRGPNDLEERIEQLEKQKEILQSACKRAGARIRDLEGEISIVKGIGMSSPEMKKAEARIKELEVDNKILVKEVDRLSEYNNNLETILKGKK